MQQIDLHQSGDVMACSMDGDCSASCSLDDNKKCSCNHAASGNNAISEHTLCGCSHHGDKPIGTVSPFQIKAPLVSSFDGITFSPTSVFPSLKQHHLFIFSDDIFHPPRLSA